MRYGRILIVFAIFGSMNAKAEELCSDALITANVAQSSNRSYELSTLSLITIDNWQESKRKFSGGLTLPVDGIPISGFADYESFDKARQNEFRRSEFKSSGHESEYYAASFVQPEAFNAYVECLKARSLSQTGLHIIPRQLQSDFVGLDIYWIPPATAVRSTSVVFDIQGGKATATLPRTIAPNSFVPLNFNRETTKAFRFTASAGGFEPARLDMPRFVAPPSRPEWTRSGFKPSLNVLAHVQEVGDINGREFTWVGTKEQGKRLEGFQVDVSGRVQGVSLEYMCHIEGQGDTAWMPQGSFCGTRDQSRRLEGLAFRLTGPEADKYAVSYLCHIQNIGDVGPSADGFCGTRGRSLRVEAIDVGLKRN